MNIKISVFLFALFISCSSLFYSCQSASEKKEAAAEEVVEETDGVTEAEFATEKQEWQKELDNKIAAWEVQMIEIDKNIESKGDQASPETKEKYSQLEKDLHSIKLDLERAGNTAEAGWQDFKADVNVRADKIANDIDNFFGGQEDND